MILGELEADIREAESNWSTVQDDHGRSDTAIKVGQAIEKILRLLREMDNWMHTACVCFRTR